MLSNEAQTELERKLERAREIMTAIMEAGDSGAVTIGYGNQGLRLVQHRHEKPVSVNPAPKMKALLR